MNNIYREKDATKNILEFPEHFSSRSHHKLFFGPPCMFRLLLGCGNAILMSVIPPYITQIAPKQYSGTEVAKKMYKTKV